VINAVTPDPFPPDLPDLDARLSRLPAELAIPGAPPPGVLTACAAHLRSRWELNRRWTGEIAAATGLPTVVLPRLARGVTGPDDLETLAGPLLRAPQSPEAAP